MKNFKILGLEAFDAVERDTIKEIAGSYYDKISRDFPGLLILHGKKHDRDGGKAKYSFHTRLEAPDPIVEAKASDWDLARALHKVLVKVENAVQKKYKTKGKRT